MENEKRQQQERVQALEEARALTKHILERRGGKLLSDPVEVINQMREERTNELLGSGRNSRRCTWQNSRNPQPFELP